MYRLKKKKKQKKIVKIIQYDFIFIIMFREYVNENQKTPLKKYVFGLE